MRITTPPDPRWMCSTPCGWFRPGRRGSVAGRIDTAGWGLFFLWVGASFLLDVGRGIGLLGVGLLILVLQVVRRGFGLAHEGFWLFMGGALTLAAVWELTAIDVSPGPILLIAFGMAVLVWALRR